MLLFTGNSQQIVSFRIFFNFLWNKLIPNMLPTGSQERDHHHRLRQAENPYFIWEKSTQHPVTIRQFIWYVKFLLFLIEEK